MAKLFVHRNYSSISFKYADHTARSDVSNTMTFKTDTGQALTLQTSGVGTLALQTGNAPLTLISGSTSSITAKAGLDFVVPADLNAKNASFNNYSTPAYRRNGSKKYLK